MRRSETLSVNWRVQGLNTVRHQFGHTLVSEEHDHGTFIVTPFCGLVIPAGKERLSDAGEVIEKLSRTKQIISRATVCFQSENLTLVNVLSRTPLIEHVFQISKLMCFEESGSGGVSYTHHFCAWHVYCDTYSKNYRGLLSSNTYFT